MKHPADRPILYLASRSPRRQELLTSWGWQCRLVPPGPESALAGGVLEPDLLALQLARDKCLGAQLPPGARGPVLGADTLGVAPGGQLLGKPADREEAQAMLELLSGGEHLVYSGVWGRLAGREEGLGGVDRSRVLFHQLGERMIQAYLDTGRWRDKAAGYGLQDEEWPFVGRVQGERSTVVGLPQGLTAWVLERLGNG